MRANAGVPVLTTLALTIVSIAIPIPNSVLLNWNDFIVWWSDSIHLDEKINTVSLHLHRQISSAPMTIIA
jgi:hypothetical protein